MDFFYDIARYAYLHNALAACILSGIACGIMGTYVVCRRTVFLAGGITHASFGGLGIASWTKPNGGYFICLTLMDGCAKRVWSLMRQAGVVLTGAGATYPYGKDPRDANLRLAPTYSPAHELEVCIQALSACVRLASLEKMLAE